jgi:hypothetical protein
MGLPTDLLAWARGPRRPVAGRAYTRTDLDRTSDRRPSVAGRRRRRRIVIQLVALSGVVGIALVATLFMVHGRVTAESLYSAVAREADSSTWGDVEQLMGIPERCLRASSRRWRCEVVDSGQSGTAMYAVHVHDGSCWSGRLMSDVGEPMPERIHGCVRLAD